MSRITLEFLDSVDSTMDVASDLAREGAPEGTVVVAGTQRKGRGRSGSDWSSPEGGAWFSVLLTPEIQAEESHRIVLLAGLCACSVLRESLEVSATLRWPNDIVLEGKKIAGVLGEGLQTKGAYYTVVGVGVNTNINADAFPEWLREEATTTRDFLKREVDNKLLIEGIAEMLVERSTDLVRNYARIVEEWVRLSDTIGRQIESDGTPKGMAIRLDSDGFLVTVDAEGSERKIVSGNIRYLDGP
ncbi:MAG: biotin--[acetyl-CoA-carboxylase] ligase [Thermoplasmata archaeon]